MTSVACLSNSISSERSLFFYCKIDCRGVYSTHIMRRRKNCSIELDMMVFWHNRHLVIIKFILPFIGLFPNITF